MVKLPVQGALVQSLVGEPRFHMPCSMAKKKKINQLIFKKIIEKIK